MQQVQHAHPALAHQITVYQNERGRFNSYHAKRLQEIASLPGFSGSISPGDAAFEGLGESCSNPLVKLPCAGAFEAGAGEEYLDEDSEEVAEEEDDAHEEEEERIVDISQSLCDVLEVSFD